MTSSITPQKIDDLLAFLPRFTPDREYIKEWHTGDGFYWPVYHDDVAAFYLLAGESCWMDYGYNPAEAGKMVADDEFIAQADLTAVKTMLTFCVRGERFSDGHWAAMLKNGRIQAILKRLQTLREEME